jgi:hypothetical protein
MAQLAGTWDVLTLDEAYPDADEPAPPESVCDFTNLKKNRLPNPADRHLLLALSTAVYVGRFVAMLRSLRWFVFLAPLGLLIAANLYPFSSNGMLTTVLLSLATVAIVVVLRAIRQIEHDFLISQMNETKAGKVSWDAMTIQQMIGVGLFIFIVLVTQIPELSDLVMPLLGPLAKFGK